MVIFHICPEGAWSSFDKGSDYTPESLQTDGFIHCCKADQLEMVLKLFRGEENLILLRVDVSKLHCEMKIEYPREASMSALEFPHIYGPLNRDAIEAQFVLTKRDGSYQMPADIFA